MQQWISLSVTDCLWLKLLTSVWKRSPEFCNSSLLNVACRKLEDGCFSSSVVLLQLLMIMIKRTVFHCTLGLDRCKIIHYSILCKINILNLYIENTLFMVLWLTYSEIISCKMTGSAHYRRFMKSVIISFNAVWGWGQSPPLWSIIYLLASEESWQATVIYGLHTKTNNKEGDLQRRTCIYLKNESDRP